MDSKAADIMHEVTRATQLAYDANADSYAEATRDFGDFPGLIEELESFQAAVSGCGWVADLGCGAGRDTRHFVAHEIPTVAVDVSLQMLRHAIRQSDGGCAAVQSDMAQLPFRDEVFAGAWACASFVNLHSSQLSLVLHELFRVLKPGGAICASMKSGEGEKWSAGRSMTEPRWFNLMRPENFESLLADTGFRALETRWCGRPEWYVAIGRKPAQR
jgi:SAM-dependent methyltransferase